jgi:hypothetical protein
MVALSSLSNVSVTGHERPEVLARTLMVAPRTTPSQLLISSPPGALKVAPRLSSAESVPTTRTIPMSWGEAAVKTLWHER